MQLPSSAIYEIRNRVSGKSYVGSAAQLKNRWGNHKARLRRNNHHSVHLQRAWNKHGEQAFVFEALEVVHDVNHLTDREQAWMDFIQPEYNILKRAKSALGHKHGDEFRSMRSRMMREKGVSPALIEGSIRYRKGRPLTAEHREKISAAQRGRPKSDSQRAACLVAQRELARKWYETKAILVYGWAWMSLAIKRGEYLAECTERMRRIRALGN